MSATSIAWTDATANFWWGCDKVSPACTNCYAEGIDKRFGPKLDHGNTHWGLTAPRMDKRATAEHSIADITKTFAKRDRLPRIFVNSMSDWLDDKVPIEWLADLLWTLYRYPLARYQLLTKRPHLWQSRLRQVQALNHPAARLAGKWLEGECPTNWIIGTTVENQKETRRLDALCAIPAWQRFISAEPLLSDLDLSPWLSSSSPDHRSPITDHSSQKIHWIITGGESGQNARPSHPDWFRSLRDQAAAASIPFFFKQWGSWAPSPVNAVNKANTVIFPGHISISRLGKKHTGHLLDGQQHKFFPS